MADADVYTMRVTSLLKSGFAALLLALVGSVCAADTKHPNIVYILADDLGYGDVRCLNPQGKITTPHLDRLAAAGMIFTDAHSSSAVCTPTRYGLLTGRYNWRSRLKSGVMGGMSPPLIEPGRLTVPAFLQQQGYHTACIGKWHLGFEWSRRPDTAPFTDGIEKGADGWRVDFSKAIARGPNAYGFDYFFGLAASLDMVPYAFIENDRVTKVPTVDKAFPMMSGRTNGATRKGPAAADFEAIDVLPTLTRRAVAYINERAGDAKSGRPFFLYVPLNAPHTPIAPSKEWQGKSGLNPYADFVMETDARVGEVLDALDRSGVAGNTLVIFTSDNGCSPEAKFPELLSKGHNPSAQFRGTKADIFEGGHRVPFFVRWPVRVKPGTTSGQLICLNDLFATCADLLGAKLPDNAAEDSVSLLPALEGRATTPIREALVHHSINGAFAIRQGSWKLELCADSGGWSAPRPGSPAAKSLPAPQLYDLAADLAETNNVARAHPEVVARLTQLLEKYAADGRSTPGAAQPNTTPVVIHRAAVTSAANAASPNILFCFADDWGRYAGAYAKVDGVPSPNDIIKTPNIDRIAREGVLFRNAFVPAPSCTPCRSALLSGRYWWNTGRAAILQGAVWDTNISSFPLLLRDAGYHIGKSFKVWSPGTPADAPFGQQKFAYEKAGRDVNNFSENVTKWMGDGMSLEAARDKILAQVRDNFDAFLADRQPGKPWLYWFGPTTTHRTWIKGSGKKLWGIEPDSLRGRMPKFLPDVPEVREDLADYLGEAQAYDSYVGALLKRLEESGELERTIIVVSGDHGMPGVPGGKAGRVVDDFVNLMDLAPTFMEVGGVKPPSGVDGRSFLDLLKSEKSGQVDASRTWVVTGRERHVGSAREGNLPYPMRALRTKDFLYIRNFAPDHWPMGAPYAVTATSAPTTSDLESNTRVAFPDMDASPTKAWLVEHRAGASHHHYYDHAFAKRPAEELYDLRTDPHQTNNVADKASFLVAKNGMAKRLIKTLTDTLDPRVTGVGLKFDRSPFTDPEPVTNRERPKR